MTARKVYQLDKYDFDASKLPYLCVHQMFLDYSREKYIAKGRRPISVWQRSARSRCAKR
jgi:hypothetical protein